MAKVLVERGVGSLIHFYISKNIVYTSYMTQY